MRQGWVGLFCLLLCPAPLMAESEAQLLNAMRQQAGLPALEPHPALQQAAAAHAAYLDRHREPGDSGHGSSAHAQQADAAGFSGATPAERAVAAGYPHRDVLENVSMGYADARRALDGLMSAIYHRLTFLDLEADQLGVAVGEQSRVFLLGRSDLTALCAAPPAAARYRTPVDCLGTPMVRSHHDALCEDLPEAALFRASHPVACPNGVRLQAAFMAGICADPPAEARFSGHGRYYRPCGDATRISAAWFDRLCEQAPPAAVYSASGSYYELCEEQRVDAEWFEQYCAALPAQAVYRDSWRFRRPCADDSIEVRSEYLDELDHRRRADLPKVIVWPPDRSVDVPPAFFIEEPDPLPDLELSGYPVSIQFNPSQVQHVELRSFELFPLDQDQDQDQAPAIDEVRLLDRSSDPHGLLGDHEFALFPLRRLAWGGRYRARVDAILDGRQQQFEWTFSTQGDDLPLLTAATARQRFFIQSGQAYLLYLPPDDEYAQTVSSTRATHLRGNQVSLQVLDPNTLKLQVDAERCDRIELQFDSGRRVELIPRGCPG